MVALHEFMHDFGKHGGFVILDLLLPTYCVGWILQDDPLTANCHRLTWVETNSNMLIMYENMTEARDPISKTSPRAVCCALWHMGKAGMPRTATKLEGTREKNQGMRSVIAFLLAV
ncbi:hypothetical protein NA56DRAFT_696085 [Hyaloscypha hepaticicola]|uniref:Uncharacterized protein n=1 Tax=Hyaloscypha hepaticicola TaxID=2082293 RepID=A0A2J6QPY7_9HELO|nr:hypothetical protein NA56DRAFT_696085 [Hyaloscypha hepaticicola]